MKHILLSLALVRAANPPFDASFLHLHMGASLGCATASRHQHSQEDTQDGAYSMPKVRRMSCRASETSSLPASSAFPPKVLGYYSNTGHKPDGKPVSGSEVVQRTINQDRGIVSYPFLDKPLALLAVCDGHGSAGDVVAEYACTEIAERLAADPRATTDLGSALTRHIKEVDASMLAMDDIPSDESGTTAVVLLLSESMAITANVGDSRAVLGRAKAPEDGSWLAYDLTTDQKPDDPKERKRIMAAGGLVTNAKGGTPARAWRKKGKHREGRGIAMARSIGDHSLGKILTAEPVVTTVRLKADDQCIIVASDGVWEFINSQEAVDLVCAQKGAGASAACRALMDEATARWKRFEGEAYRDGMPPATLPATHGSSTTLQPACNIPSDLLSCGGVQPQILQPSSPFFLASLVPSIPA